MGSIRRSKTKRRTRDLDQVHADIHSAKHLSQHKKSKAVEDLPGLGQWYCIECAKWFQEENSLLHHRKGKNHKRRSYYRPKSYPCAVAEKINRVRLLKEKPYSQKEAEAAIGLGVDNGQRSDASALDEGEVQMKD